MTRKTLTLLATLGSAALILGALGFQYIGGLYPCKLCYWQRYGHFAAIAAGIVALFVAGAFAISFACHGAWALLLSARPVREAYARGRAWVEGTLGLFFSFAAWKLATTRI